MSLDVRKNEALSRFEIYSNGELAGFAEYQMRASTMIFPHTEIDPRFGGKGLGSTLVLFALDSAKSDGYEVAPDCPFVAKIISNFSDRYLNLVPESKRAKYKLI